MDGSSTSRSRFKDIILLLARGDLKTVEAMLPELKYKVYSDWEKGYLKAVEGIVLGLRKDSPNIYVKMIYSMDNDALDREVEIIEKSFLEKPDFLRDKFQEGFFTCILDLVKALSDNRRIKD